MAQEADKLRTLLGTLPTGEITDEGVLTEIARTLGNAWGELDGGQETRMSGNKLGGGRMEDVRWEPPVLSFTIERHGGTVQGSSRGELYAWSVDVANMTTGVAPAGFRQLYAMKRPLDCAVLVSRVANAVTEDHDAPFLVRYDGKVRVVVKDIPELAPKSACKQTLAARRKRFRAALVAALKTARWREASQYCFEPED